MTLTEDQAGTGAIPGGEQMPVPQRPLTGDVTPGEMTADAEAYAREAGEATASAGRDRGEAEQLLADARAEAARIIGEAEAAAQKLGAAATAAGRMAETLEAHTRWLTAAAREQAKADEAGARAEALEDERDRLTEQAAGLGERLGQLAGDRQALTTQLAAALSDGDVDAITALRGRIGATDELAGSLSGQRSAALARMEAIGTGEVLPVWPQKELAEARRIAEGARTGVRRVLNDIYPGRPEALADAARAELGAVMEAHRARIAEEQAAQRLPARRNVVHLNL